MRTKITIKDFEFELSETTETQILKFMKDKSWICSKMLEVGLNIPSSTSGNVLQKLVSQGTIKDIGYKNVKFNNRGHQVHAYSLK